MGMKLGEKIAREWEDLDIDVVIPLSQKPRVISRWKLLVFWANRTARASLKTAMLAAPLSCRASSCVVSPCAVN